MRAQSSGEWVPPVCLCGLLLWCCLMLLAPVSCCIVVRNVIELGSLLLVPIHLCVVVFLP